MNLSEMKMSEIDTPKTPKELRKTEKELEDQMKSIKVPKEVEKKRRELEARMRQEKEKYTTLFKQKPKLPSCDGIFPKLPKVDRNTFFIGGGFLLLLLIWYSIKYYELFLPFAGGALRLFKYFLICSAIFYFMVTFVQTTNYFYWWYESTLYFFRRFVDPLLNQRVKYWYYYFTDYINWIIYYPVKLYYLIRFLANVVFFLLIILPTLAFIAFFIGLLFSWIGERDNDPSILTPVVDDFKGGIAKATDVAHSVGSAAQMAKGALGTMLQSGAIGNLLQAKASNAKVPGLETLTKALPVSPSNLQGLAQDPSKIMDMATGTLRRAG